MRTSPPWYGLVLAAAVALSFAGNTASARLAFDGGAAPLTMNVARLAAAGLILLAVLKASGVSLRLDRRTRLTAWALGPLMFGYQFSLLSALDTIPLALAILVFYSFPILTSLYSWASGRERVTPLGIVAVLTAFIGLSLALDVTSGHLRAVGVLLAFLAAIGVTTMLQLNHRLVGGGDSRPVTLNMLASAAVTGALVSLLTGHVAPPTTDAGWAAFALSSLLFSFAIICMFVAMTMIGPLRMALTMNLEPITSMVLGVVLLGQALTPVQVLGGALVIVTVLLVRLMPGPRPQPQGASSHG